MDSFPLNGVEVCLSSLTQRSYRAACCEFLVYVTPKNLRAALALFKKGGHKFDGLRISGVADLSFLGEFDGLRYLEIVDQKKFNTRCLDGLSNLRGLCVETPGAGIDFACFPELEVFVGDWHEENKNVHRANELRQLRAWHFQPESLDLGELARCTRLEWLQLTQTGITSLAGVETLNDLRYFEVAHAPKLASIDALASGDLQLRELAFEKCKSIATYQPIAALRWLRRLRLSACAPMPDLKWTRGMREFDMFSFVETNVEDGDLAPLLALPKLRYVGTSDKKHYNYKSQAINSILERRG